MNERQEDDSVNCSINLNLQFNKSFSCYRYEIPASISVTMMKVSVLVVVLYYLYCIILFVLLSALSLASTNRLSLSSQEMGTGVSKSLLDTLYILNLFLTTSHSEITRPTWRVDTGMSVGSDPGPAKRTRIVTSASLTALPVVTQSKEVKALFILILTYFINLNPFQHSQINLEAFHIIII